MLLTIPSSAQSLPVPGGLISDAIDVTVKGLRGALLRREPSSDRRSVINRRAVSTFADVSEALSAYRGYLSSVSMHMMRDDWLGLNRQLTRMFDDDEWEEDDKLPSLSTFKSFVTLLFILELQRRPGLGTDGRGSFTASWTNGENRLTIDCYEKGQVRWIVSRAQPDGVERAAGYTTLNRIRDVLSPYEVLAWA